MNKLRRPYFVKLREKRFTRFTQLRERVNRFIKIF